ncbi:hypothetical protein F511_31536 [Dorcoceras hygrometricum]|uniref:Uncharacterized protein n=1 Tax=Dorcoceras hygrometricum TaxID=472368 RepID=A0A2Z7CGD5_9LAMI|nr:hypothetical protein F511_31536 [Dorcoceras hygrometricum]
MGFDSRFNPIGCEGERRYRTLISLLGSLATMRRVVNYHSSWARQRQVELFDASGCEGERRYRTLISLLGSLATMRRVVNYHSSWARQRQVELFDASGIRVLYHDEWLITTL